MNNQRIKTQSGFSLLEMTVAIVIVGILMAVAMQSMTSMIEDIRQIKTEREMELLSKSIVGDPDVAQNGGRVDFGYVGDIGAFPPNLNALYTNPGGYSTWKGPYLPTGYTQDSTGLKTDEWGIGYNYSGGVTITSTGSGTTITKKIARLSTDYLQNKINGVIKDKANTLPGATKKDSVDIKITVPNGSGSTLTKLYRPNASGSFTLDSIPAGTHPLRIIYTPNADTIFRYLTVYPRHKSGPTYKFASAYFTAASGCGSSGFIVLRPNASGALAGLTTSGCAANWQCVSEVSSDDDATRVIRASNTYATDVYAFPDSTFTCPILSVTVYCRARFTQATGAVKPAVRIAGTLYEGTAQNLTTTYANYNHRWLTSPATGSAWTWLEVNNFEAGLSLQGQNAGFPAYCTQAWIEVEY